MWPYIISKFTKRPPAKCFSEALKHQIMSYHAIYTLDEMRACLSAGFPFGFGFTVYESFESEAVANTGVVNMPKRGEKAIGGHYVYAIGHDDKRAQFKVRNSWGGEWGLHGNFTIPYAYLSNPRLASDIWTVRGTE
jgi:C1A family cysteine protease